MGGLVSSDARLARGESKKKCKFSFDKGGVRRVYTRLTDAAMAAAAALQTGSCVKEIRGGP